MRWSIEKVEPLAEGFFRLERVFLRYETFAGAEVQVEREHFERGDAVGVVVHDPKADAVLLVEQFRIGPAMRKEKPWLVEIVAGMIDEGETPLDCARREAMEEAGCALDRIRPLGVCYASPGGSSERFFLFFAEADREKQQRPKPEADEDLRAFWVPVDQAMDWCWQGRIASALPLVALCWAFPDRWAEAAQRRNEEEGR